MSLSPTTIKPAKGAKKTSKRKGRGNASGAGNYSGRGGKGQRARSGGKSGLKLKGFKPILQSTPKLRGYNSLKIKPTEIYLSTLEKKYNDGETVSFMTLKAKCLLGKRNTSAKIILNGELTKKLIIEGVRCTAGALEAIKKAGGEVKYV